MLVLPDSLTPDCHSWLFLDSGLLPEVEALRLVPVRCRVDMLVLLSNP